MSSPVRDPGRRRPAGRARHPAQWRSGDDPDLPLPGERHRPGADGLTDEAGTIVKVCDPDCTGSNPAYLVTHNGHGDALALWRITGDGSLTLANSYTYSTWGAPTTATHNAYPDLGYRYLYVGAQGVAWDNALGLGLLHMGARHYCPGSRPATRSSGWRGTSSARGRGTARSSRRTGPGSPNGDRRSARDSASGSPRHATVSRRRAGADWHAARRHTPT